MLGATRASWTSAAKAHRRHRIELHQRILSSHGVRARRSQATAKTTSRKLSPKSWGRRAPLRTRAGHPLFVIRAAFVTRSRSMSLATQASPTIFASAPASKKVHAPTPFATLL